MADDPLIGGSAFDSTAQATGKVSGFASALGRAKDTVESLASAVTSVVTIVRNLNMNAGTGAAAGISGSNTVTGGMSGRVRYALNTMQANAATSNSSQIGPNGVKGYLSNFGGNLISQANANVAAGQGAGLSFGQVASAAGAPGGAGAIDLGLKISKALSGIGGAIAKPLNDRIERGYAYSLSADKMNMMYQQMTGMSQQGVQNAFRDPLTKYKLGGSMGEGMQALLGMQATVGINALNQARSVEAIRAINGFGMSAEDATKMVTSLGSASVVNRMFMTTGTALYGVGGKENQTLDVIQSAARGAGLMDPKIAKNALQQGSLSRARLTFMGIPEDMQDTVIRYAQSNLEFKKKGGKGDYDPSKDADRKIMGVQENLATAKEETDRIKTRREENFYGRQADNFADLEDKTKKLTQAMGALEDSMSGLIGQKISNQPYTKAGSGIMKGIGGGLLAAGMMTGFTPAGWAMMGTGAVLSLAGGLLGDPMPSGTAAEKSASRGPSGGPGSNSTSTASTDGMKIPSYGSGGTTIGKLKTSSTFSNLHPTFQDRLLKMIVASGGKVGVGQGLRSSKGQESLFLSRYKPTSEETDIFWNGTYWKHTNGAPAAPPGRSMHEIGLAADLVGDIDWVVKNAGRFGLKHFADVNGEPWHVQPAELPGGRVDYEKQGAPWGLGPPGAAAYDPKATFGANSGISPEGIDVEGSASSGGGGVQLYSGMSTADIIDAMHSQNLNSVVSGGGSVSGGGGRRRRATGPQLYGKMSGQEIVSLMERVGFRGEDLVKAVGISYRESRWNPMAHNGNAGTGDNSYGLFQINMINKLGPARLKSLGLTKYEDLFDPEINARSAKKMHDSAGWHPWGGYKGQSETTHVDMAKAAATVEAYKTTGDPIFPTRAPAGSGGNTYVDGGTNITIAPNIHIHGSGDWRAEIKQIAREVGRELEREIRLTRMRSN